MMPWVSAHGQLGRASCSGVTPQAIPDGHSSKGSPRNLIFHLMVPVLPQQGSGGAKGMVSDLSEDPGQQRGKQI